MTASTTPIYTKTPQVTWAKITAADGSTDGTDADVALVATAGSDAAFLRTIIFQPRSTSGSTTTSVATGRIYLNNGSTVGTGTNNVLIGEINLTAQTVNVTGTAAVANFIYPFFRQLKATYCVYVGITAVAANTCWDVTAEFGDY